MWAMIRVSVAELGVRMNDIVDEHLLPLSEVVEELRLQIAEVASRSKKRDLRFVVNSVELEFSVVAKREGGGDGKIKFSVLGLSAEAGASGKVAHERTQKIKFSLTPVDESPALARSSSELPQDKKLFKISRTPASRKPASKKAAASKPR